MSTDKWKERVERFRKTDPVVATVVILALILLLVHEGFAITTGRVPFAGPNGDGPYGRILLGLIASVTAFWVRQARKDVLTDTSITAEVRDRVSTMQDNGGGSHEGDVEKLIAAMKAERLAAEETLKAEHQRERHKIEGYAKVAEQASRDYERMAEELKQQVRDLTAKLGEAAKSHHETHTTNPGDRPC
jgi:hypothetical protein